MTLQQRDKRALTALGVAAAVFLAVYSWPSGETAPAVVEAAPPSIPAAEQRLARLREIVATVPGKQKVADTLAAQLAGTEKGFLTGETAAQAQAHLLQIVRRLARAQAPPIDIGQADMGLIRALGKDYGEALVSITTTCRIDQLVQLLADITAQPELIATEDIRVNAGDVKQKLVAVRLTVSGVIPRRLAPERRGGPAF
jgi:hypothetical protein